MVLGRKFYLLLVGGLIIQVAVSVKNSLEKLKMEDPKVGLVAKGAFVLGWLIVAYSISLSGNKLPLRLKTLLAFGGAAAVVAGVFHVKSSKKAGKEPNKIISMGFPVGWVLLMFALLMGSGKKKTLAILAVALVLGSMMFVIPYQRDRCMVDGPGYNMFVNAWWLLALANN